QTAHRPLLPTRRASDLNAGTCQATVTVSDSSLPTAVCQNIAVSLDATGHVSVNATAIENGSTDNCGVTEHKITKGTVSANDASFADSVSFGCGDTGAQTVTLQVKDAAGNAGTCQATVTVSDSSLPTAVCRNIAVSLDATGHVSVNARSEERRVGDECGWTEHTIAKGTVSAN